MSSSVSFSTSVSQVGFQQANVAKQSGNNQIIFKLEDISNGFSITSAQYTNIARLIKENKESNTELSKIITLGNAIDRLEKENSCNPEMRAIVLECVKNATGETKIATLEKGLAFLQTEKNLSKLVSEKKLELETAKEILTQCLDFGSGKDFSLKNLNEFNTSLEELNGENVGEEVRKLTESFGIKNNLTVQQQQNEIEKSQLEKSSHNENQTSALDKGSPKTSSTEETVTILENSGKEITSKDLAESTFEQLLEYPWENHNSNKANTIKGTIQDLINTSSGKFDKKLLNSIQETLEKNFGIDQKTFNRAWAKAISTTQGGEELRGKIGLKIGGEDVNLNLKFTPQAKMSGFTGDTTGMKHCSSVYESTEVGATKHAVNLWRQDIEVKGKKSISFLRHGYILEQENAAKEILANACALQHDEESIKNASKDKPLTLNFTNVQLMSFGKIADKDKPLKQMDKFNELAKQDQPIELNYGGEKFYVKFEKPLLFNFAVNMQHFRHLEIGNSDAQNKVKEQNLESFKQLFGENFPKNVKNNDGNVVFEEGSLIKKYLDNSEKGEDSKAQIQTLANQILDIYKNHPEGLKENPYALPTRVLALTNLLSYASSFNCKSGKDRTGVCAMELTNLCAQMMAGEKINNPMEAISDEERQNLQEIYKEGSCVRDIPKVNTVVQTGLKTDKDALFKHTNNRFGLDLTKSFEENVKNLNA